MDTVIFNVYGTEFEISTDTFNNLPKSFSNRLLKGEFGYKRQKRLFFIERHPDVFKYVLMYYQFGELHMPRSVCPSLFKKELEYWGVDITCLENCCLDIYGMAHENLCRLDEFEKDYEVTTEEQGFHRFPSKWERLRKTMWEILDNPFASRWSEIFYWSSILFVFLSIFALTAATHPLFKKLTQLEDIGGFIPDWTVTRSGSDVEEEKRSIHDSQDDVVSSGGSSSGANGSSVGGSGNSSVFSYSGESAKVYGKSREIKLLEFMCFVFFTIEVILKLVFCPRFRTFFCSVLNIVDILAIFPLYFLYALQFFSVPRQFIIKTEHLFEGIAVLRVFRLLRLGRRIRGLRVLIYAIRSGLKDVLLMCLMLFMATIIFASLMYYVDSHMRFPSIPHGLWWAIVTLTTVGYGDMVPETAQGKLLGSLCAITGLLIVSITVPIFVSKFLLYYNHVARKHQVSEVQNKQTPAYL